MRLAVDRLVDRVDADLDDEEGEVLESYRMFAHDRGWLERIRDVIRSGITAEAAVERIKNDTRQRMAKVRDPYLRERLADLEDLAYRLLQHLSGVHLVKRLLDLIESDALRQEPLQRQPTLAV